MFRNLEWLSRDCVRNLRTFDYKFFTGLKDNLTWDNMVQNRWLKHLQLAKYFVFLPDSFSFSFASSISVSFALLYCDYHVTVSFLSTWKRVLIGCFFFGLKTLVEWNKERENPLWKWKTYQGFLGNNWFSESSSDISGLRFFLCSRGFLHHQNKGNVDPPFGTLRRHFSPGKVNKYFVSWLESARTGKGDTLISPQVGTFQSGLNCSGNYAVSRISQLEVPRNLST